MGAKCSKHCRQTKEAQNKTNNCSAFLEDIAMRHPATPPFYRIRYSMSGETIDVVLHI